VKFGDFCGPSDLGKTDPSFGPIFKISALMAAPDTGGYLAPAHIGVLVAMATQHRAFAMMSRTGGACHDERGSERAVNQAVSAV
jgi:hypothetical protein